MIRGLEFLLTLGLGASLAIVAPRLWTRPAPAPVSVAPTPPVITPLPAPTKTLVDDAVVVTRPVLRSDAVIHVITANRGGIESCVQRWLLRGQGAAPSKLEIKLNIGISGRVKHLHSPDRRFQALEPCLREAAARWLFPQNDEEYGVEFALAMHTSSAD